MIKKYDVDTILLIDAGIHSQNPTLRAVGVDSLLKHDEQGLGTFGEDLMSIFAARQCNVPNKYLLTVGLGTEGGISEYVLFFFLIF